jgi:superfamily I DNA/RNA helicase
LPNGRPSSRRPALKLNELIALLQHVLDYDDLLLYWEQMMQEPSIATDVSDRFDHVLVDVYQDTNRLHVLDLICR